LRLKRPYGALEAIVAADGAMNCRAIFGDAYGTGGGVGRVRFSGIPFVARKRDRQLQYRYVRKLHMER
jgi:hypothetical protein